MKRRIGLIAGNGPFPLMFAKQARQAGFSVVAVAHLGETDQALSDQVDEIEWLQVGAVESLISVFKKAGVSRAVMAGGIRKSRIFEPGADSRAQSMLSSLPVKSDDSLLRAFARELQKEEIEIQSPTAYLSHLLAKAGEMTRGLTPEEEEAVRWGWPLAKKIGAMDIGQCIVIKGGVILSVEAIEGTDAAIRRGGALGGVGVMVIKICKPQQDLRFDLPAVGVATLETMREVGATALVVEAEKTLLFDKEKMLQMAREAGIAILGYCDHA